MSTVAPRFSFKEQMHQAREDAIVTAAGRLLAEKGFDSMTVDEVAAAVGIAKASLYKHFSGKGDLCSAAMVRVVRQVQEFLGRLPQDLAPIERLRALLRRSLELQLSDDIPLLPARNSSLSESLRDCAAYQSAIHGISKQAIDWVRQAQHSGDIAPRWPADVVLCSLLARASDPMLALLRERGNYSNEQMVEWAMDTCLEGLLARPA
jgi:AcrR family transcriptional regulator